MFSSLSPKILLDHYWMVFDIIKGELPIASPSITVNGILNILSEESSSIDNPYYSRKYIRAQEVVKDVIVQLAELELIEKTNEHIKKRKEYSEFFYFLENIKDSVTRRLSWAVWYLYSKGVNNFTTSQILEELSYSDEGYRRELDHLIVWKNEKWLPALKRNEEDNSWQLLNEIYSSKKPVLLQDLPERIFTAIVKMSKREFSEDEIIQKIRELEKKSVEMGLRKLKLDMNGNWQINSVALSKTQENLKGKQLPNWPFFGNIGVRKNPYFKILRRTSCTLYVDVPNQIVEEPLKELGAVSMESKNREEFYTRACEVVDNYNNSLKWLDWLHFKMSKNKFMSKYGFKVSINWNKFMSFLEDLSKEEIPLWNKYYYISSCRYPSLELVLRGKLERTQEDVKKISEDDRNEIQRELDELIRYLEIVKQQIIKILKRKKLRELQVESTVLQYLPEMISTIEALKNSVDYGTIPPCYREMRKILESLAWAVFDDILQFRIVKRGIKLVPPPYRYVSREWYEESIKQKNRKEFILRNLSVLKGEINKLIPTELAGSDKNTLEKAIFENLSYTSFLLILGVDAADIVKDIGVFVRYDTSSLLTPAREDFREAAKVDLTVDLDPDEFGDRAMKILEKTAPSVIVPPYPQNKFVITFVDKTFSTSLDKKYDEYSFFVHSYLTSWYIFPFSSVLEFKILRHELKSFSEVIKKLLSSYLELLSI